MKRNISRIKYEIAKRMREYGESYEMASMYCYKYFSTFGYKDFSSWMLPSEEEVIEIIEDWDNVVMENRSGIVYGIYGIYMNDELVYIGKTENDFSKRFSNYKSEMKKNLIEKLFRCQQMRKRRKRRQNLDRLLVVRIYL